MPLTEESFSIRLTYSEQATATLKNVRHWAEKKKRKGGYSICLTF